MGEVLAAVEEHAGVPRGRQCIIVTGDGTATRRLATRTSAGVASDVGLSMRQGALSRAPEHLGVCETQC